MSCRTRWRFCSWARWRWPRSPLCGRKRPRRWGRLITPRPAGILGVGSFTAVYRPHGHLVPVAGTGRDVLAWGRSETAARKRALRRAWSVTWSASSIAGVDAGLDIKAVGPREFRRFLVSIPSGRSFMWFAWRWARSLSRSIEGEDARKASTWSCGRCSRLLTMATSSPELQEKTESSNPVSAQRCLGCVEAGRCGSS